MPCLRLSWAFQAALPKQIAAAFETWLQQQPAWLEPEVYALDDDDDDDDDDEDWTQLVEVDNCMAPTGDAATRAVVQQLAEHFVAGAGVQPQQLSQLELAARMQKGAGWRVAAQSFKERAAPFETVSAEEVSVAASVGAVTRAAVEAVALYAPALPVEPTAASGACKHASGRSSLHGLQAARAKGAVRQWTPS